MMVQNDTSFETIGRYYYEEKMSISYIEYKHGVSRERVIEMIDEYDRHYNSEKYLATPQVKDVVHGLYLYKARTYEIIGVIAAKYTRSCKIDLIGGDKLPNELLGSIVLPMNGRLNIIEKDFMDSKSYLELPKSKQKSFDKHLGVLI